MGRPRKYPRKEDVQSSSANDTKSLPTDSTESSNSKLTEDNLMIPNIIVKVKKKEVGNQRLEHQKN